MNLDAVATLVRSESVADRLNGLAAIRNAIDERPAREQEVFDLRAFNIARRLLKDCDNDCRWQAGIIVGDYIEDCPSEVWEVMLEYGPDADDDMLDLLGTVVLEHILERHFDEFFVRIEQRILAGEAWLRNVLMRCWKYEQPAAQWDRVVRLIESSGSS